MSPEDTVLRSLAKSSLCIHFGSRAEEFPEKEPDASVGGDRLRSLADNGDG